MGDRALALTRRLAILGAGAAFMPLFAYAQSRSPLPGGGSVAVPSPYRTKPDYPTYANRADNVLVAYRNWRSTMSGHPECDGMVAVGLSERFQSLESFASTGRAALSIQWGDADRIPGQAWDGNERRYTAERRDGDSGPELVQQLAVHRVGFFGVYDEPAYMFAEQHRSGLSIAVWIYSKHGGISGARKIASRIASSFER
jgi:hypothetical protein